MLEINLKQLGAFVATAEYRSFTKAAEAMYLTQSTVSAHINGLEQILGVRLIQRGARQRVALTEEGERVYREAKSILNQCQALQDMGDRGTKKQLVLGASPVPARWLMPELMARFAEHFPDSRYVQLGGDSVQIHRLLEQGKIRLGFVGTEENRQTNYYNAVAEDRLVVITPHWEEYRELQCRGVSGRDLLSRPMILGLEGADIRQAMEAYLESSGIPWDSLNVVAEIGDPEAVRAGVSRGLGISVVSWLTVREAVERGTVLAFELDNDAAQRKIFLTWRKDTVLTDLEHRFVRLVQEYRTAEKIQ